LLRQSLEVFGTKRRVIQRHQVAMQAKRGRAAHLEVQIGGVPLDELLQDRLEVEDLRRAR
jgi:hypothetical protein